MFRPCSHRRASETYRQECVIDVVYKVDIASVLRYKLNNSDK